MNDISIYHYIYTITKTRITKLLKIIETTNIKVKFESSKAYTLKKRNNI